MISTQQVYIALRLFSLHTSRGNTTSVRQDASLLANDGKTAHLSLLRLGCPGSSYTAGGGTEQKFEHNCGPRF
jgi:hypothetical protein